MQRDEIDGLAGKIITQKDIRPLRTEGKPVGYLMNKRRPDPATG